MGSGVRQQGYSNVPDDVQRELDACPRAKAAFSEHNEPFAILYQLQDAKKPETCARPLAKFVAMLEAGGRIVP